MEIFHPREILKIEFPRRDGGRCLKPRNKNLPSQLYAKLSLEQIYFYFTVIIICEEAALRRKALLVDFIFIFGNKFHPPPPKKGEKSFTAR